MNSIQTTDSKSFFPKAEDISENLKLEHIKRIITGKSDLANYILREINDFKTTGKSIEIEMDKHQACHNERVQIKKLLYEQGWKVETCVRKIEINQWPYLEGNLDEVLHWKITKQEKVVN